MENNNELIQLKLMATALDWTVKALEKPGDDSHLFEIHCEACGAKIKHTHSPCHCDLDDYDYGFDY